ncbi:hypothetical protein HID58_095693 [Brassica napus]|uniref:BnaC06g43630D protein n=2 Tax=Brassica napus TaxID=3708 RepID=A0A078J6C7_BRANA|nr:hypothetical protein HID58_095693 [Brassica napus]CAF2063765.1 unnamed protein product [Brassica napus]CDY59989.1 BnaC06g43630D [Brassica napus]
MLGVLVSLLRILTKAVYPQDPDGLRKCVNLYFAVGIVVMVPITKTLWQIVMRIKSHGFGSFSNLIYIVTLSIFPGYITEDVHSELLGDWYPVLVIAGFNVFDLVGKCLTAVFTVRCFSGQRFL